ncbi:MAG: YbaY family lipoprotein [Oceanospirillaceae bacterium]|nr:YbaY family lipoprotein [Oceanospirillaceae bacterium]
MRLNGGRGVWLAVVLGTLAGCSSGVRDGGSETLDGEVTYRERIMLPPGAQVRVRLEDVSRADAPAELIAEQLIEPKTQVPVPFSLLYYPAAIEPGHSYAVRAEIRSASDQLLWTTTERNSVLGDGQPSDDLRLVLQRVAGKAPEAKASAAGPNPWTEAAARGVDFRGIGNEPGWSLEIDDGNRIQLVTDYGQRTINTPAPAPRFEGGIVHYDVRTEAHSLNVEIEPVACQDSMSGEAFEARVRVRLGDSLYQGCGRYLATTR